MSRETVHIRANIDLRPTNFPWAQQILLERITSVIQWRV